MHRMLSNWCNVTGQEAEQMEVQVQFRHWLGAGRGPSMKVL